MATTKAKTNRKRYSQSETREKSNAEHEVEEHLRLLEHLDRLPLSDSCCEICHCDCYNSHRSSNVEYVNDEHRSSSCLPHANDKTKTLINTNTNNNNNTIERKLKRSNSNGKIKTLTLPRTPKSKNAKQTFTLNTSNKHKQSEQKANTNILELRRSKSASSLPHKSASLVDLPRYCARDCEILQELLHAFDGETPRLEVTNAISKQEPAPVDAAGEDGKQLELCESMASLCLLPTVREAYERMPAHDQKILNRMARKRSERAVAKENAWLARKYWENERYERELLKYEQMEEYQRAVRDKRFHDYQLTKARLRDLAQRDWAELQRLRETLQQKDADARQRLTTMRVERDIRLCEQRCDELRKSEAACVQQDEQQLDGAMRKQAMCLRLDERMQRAQQIRARLLNAYLERLRYDNYHEQLLHEQHWRETQRAELQKRELLKQHINHKSTKSRRFIEQRQRRLEALTQTARIAAGLRELVRSSVTPDTASYPWHTTSAANLGEAGESLAEGAPMVLSKLLHAKSTKKICL